MRKQLENIEEAVGLTVKGAVLAGGTGAISFEGGSFIVFEIDRGYDDDICMHVNRYPVEPDYYLVKAGIFTEEEHMTHTMEYKAREEERERKELARLKVKYEAEE